MIIIGASGHAKELLSILPEEQLIDQLYFFDEITPNLPDKLYDVFPILRNTDQVKEIFTHNTDFAVGIGRPQQRYQVSQKFKNLGGTLTSVIAATASIGQYDVTLEPGINIMSHVIITNSVILGEGALINARTSLHHDVSVGQYAEISPGCNITGGVTIGNFATIGAGATILPKIKIGDGAIVGAGAVVTKDVAANTVVIGTPARVIKVLE
ncbi:acetyltransferase [Pontibacter qinzhouensis]|uniref:Acetyltransferase n=1 Tax=Pontibacter qinzhouensis TaxID=2603253 RepID=A0A5C8K8K9_9BACT|nr:acetyltransferase [Pontibacter qinzhouensis]TXK49866.1 acetyltransferase [Pontibacter qinzhouensis]